MYWYFLIAVQFFIVIKINVQIAKIETETGISSGSCGPIGSWRLCLKILHSQKATGKAFNEPQNTQQRIRLKWTLLPSEIHIKCTQ